MAETQQVITGHVPFIQYVYIRCMGHSKHRSIIFQSNQLCL